GAGQVHRPPRLCRLGRGPTRDGEAGGRLAGGAERSRPDLRTRSPEDLAARPGKGPDAALVKEKPLPLPTNDAWRPAGDGDECFCCEILSLEYGRIMAWRCNGDVAADTIFVTKCKRGWLPDPERAGHSISSSRNASLASAAFLQQTLA